MATGPYRARIERPPTCAKHAEAIATEVCARCGSHVCLDCLGYGGVRSVCVACARVARRRSGLLRVAAVLVVAVAAAAPGLAAVGVPQSAPTGSAAVRAIWLKNVARTCATDQLDLLLTGLVMRGHDREVVEAGEAFAAECAMSEQGAGMVARARARLAGR